MGPLIGERRTAEQDVAGRWGQLARCTGPGSRTPSQWCIFMSGVDSGVYGPLGTCSGAPAWPPLQLVSGQWCNELDGPAVT